MRARDLAVEYETVTVDTDALAAARLMASHRLPGLLVLDGQGAPKAILPASQMIRMLVPGYVLEDPALAAVIDEKHADRLCAALRGRTVGDCLPPKAPAPPVAAPDDTALEVAALMAQQRSPLVAVVERYKDGTATLLGVITAAHLLDRLLDAAPPTSPTTPTP
ncbi:CBS domain-containing protein [Streptomyces sp. H34-S4]|uniref:CBS domain-containing protein n=1 Tax=Streptomyces sp. H34-S4 TaxID=2996463 RepID=UPI002270F9A4|nr:CBS domain-containing protein [Streptomyces sp. H34-S4]MCY0933145.1 CBS domain-containing protein [Streptomyces sp. H34-S4]